VATRLLVELDEAERVRKIRQRERGHAVGDRRLDGFVDPHDAIHDRILAVQSEMDERRIGHAEYFTSAPGATTRRVRRIHRALDNSRGRCSVIDALFRLPFANA